MVKELTLENLRVGIREDSCQDIKTAIDAVRLDIRQDIRIAIDDVLDVVKELAQNTSDGFERLDGRMGNLENRIGGLEGRADSVDITLRDHTMRFVQMQSTLDEISSKQDAHHNDIVEIYSIIQEHEKHQKIIETESRDTQKRLTLWAKSTSKSLNIPIKL